MAGIMVNSSICTIPFRTFSNMSALSTEQDNDNADIMHYDVMENNVLELDDDIINEKENQVSIIV